MRIYLIGFPGSGKTTIGKRLARLLGYSFIDLDEEVAQKAEMSIPELFAEKGAATFRKMEWEALQATEREADVVVATGGGTPLFYDAMEWMNRHGLTVFLRLPIQRLYKRLMQESTSERPVLVPPEGTPYYDHIRNLLKERLPVYHQAQLIVDAEHITPDILSSVIQLYYHHNKIKEG